MSGDRPHQQRGPHRSILRWLLTSLAAVLALSVAAPASAQTGLPDPAVDWDYQIGGARPPAPGVGTVVRDRHDEPAGGYDVCYVNAFQTQPDDKDFWRGHGRWSLVLKKAGRPVVDGAWGEWLLDTGTPAKRQRLARIVGRWIAGCAADGFDAVEPDNLDSFSRSLGLLYRRDNLALARLLVRSAHRADLAIAQKNFAECTVCAERVGFDFAVAEECQRYDECGRYAEAYDDRVLVVEYDRASFEAACAAWGSRLPIVFRDLDVSPGGPDEHC